MIDGKGWMVQRPGQQVAEPVQPAFSDNIVCRQLLGAHANFSIGDVLMQSFYTIMCKACKSNLSIIFVSDLLNSHVSGP